jgi:hypothetical protein
LNRTPYVASIPHQNKPTESLHSTIFRIHLKKKKWRRRPTCPLSPSPCSSSSPQSWRPTCSKLRRPEPKEQRRRRSRRRSDCIETDVLGLRVPLLLVPSSVSTGPLPRYSESTSVAAASGAAEEAVPAGAEGVGGAIVHGLPHQLHQQRTGAASEKLLRRYIGVLQRHLVTVLHLPHRQRRCRRASAGHPEPGARHLRNLRL